MRALGYRPTDVAVQVDSASARHLSVGLRVVPVRLQPVAVRTAGGDAYGRAAPADDARLLRVRAESARAVRYLDADSRVITDGEIRDAVTLAEPDLFRGLQRLPGVGARDDYTAALWTRGAPWDQTLVTLDGVPLYNALHAAGLVSAVDTDALGAVSFHPGVQPAGAGGASALVRLETRRGASPRPRALGELSLLSGRLAVDQVVAGGRAAYMVAARRSHVDLVPRALDLVRGAAGDRIPYAFGDVTARGDLALGGGRALEVSGVRAWDRVWGDVPGVVEETRAGWANAAARATLVAPLGAGVVRHTVAASRFAASARDTWDGELPGFRPDSCGCVYEQDPTYVAQPTDNAVRAAFLGTAWDGPAGDDGEPAVTLGARLTRERARFRTRGAWPHARRPGGMAARPDDGLGYLSMWAERRWTARSPLGAVAVRPALHVDLGPEVRNGGAVRVAPRVAARAALSPALALTAGAGAHLPVHAGGEPAGARADGDRDGGHVVGRRRARGAGGAGRRRHARRRARARRAGGGVRGGLPAAGDRRRGAVARRRVARGAAAVRRGGERGARRRGVGATAGRAVDGGVVVRVRHVGARGGRRPVQRPLGAAARDERVGGGGAGGRRARRVGVHRGRRRAVHALLRGRGVLRRRRVRLVTPAGGRGRRRGARRRLPAPRRVARLDARLGGPRPGARRRGRSGCSCRRTTSSGAPTPRRTSTATAGASRAPGGGWRATRCAACGSAPRTPRSPGSRRPWPPACGRRSDAAARCGRAGGRAHDSGGRAEAWMSSSSTGGTRRPSCATSCASPATRTSPRTRCRRRSCA
jgi:hypothetical protein